jgi:hypothetical protein
MITSRSPEYRADKRVPPAAVAAMCGRSRKALFEVQSTGRASEGLYTALSPVLPAVLRGKLRFRGSSPRGSEPNVWRATQDVQDTE